MTKTLEELQKEIELIQSQTNNKIQELIKNYELEKEKEEEFKIIERVKKNNNYYCISNLTNNENNNIHENNEIYHRIDNRYYNSNNYFHTREEAEKYLKRFLLELKILRTRDKINGDWKPDWKDGSNKICIDVDENNINEYYGQDRLNPLAFQSREKRKEFRGLISDEEIIEFLNF